MTGVLSWLLAWLLFILLLWFLAARSWGATILYYLAWLAVVFVIVTQGKQIAAIFQAGNIAGQS